MKVILQFNIPEDQEEYEVCFYGYKWKSIVEDLDNELRNHIKYDMYKHWHTETVEHIRNILSNYIAGEE